jgi:uncharacterized protein YbjT (DUF2867 family)
MFLVTGATGTVGRPLVRALRARGAAVRALVRRTNGLPAEWDDGVEPVVADLTEPGSLTAAVDGVEAIYLLTAVGPRAEEQQRNLIDAAAKAGRPRVVFQAAIGLGQQSTPVRFFSAHAVGFEDLKASGLPWTVLAPNGFMQNFLDMADSLRAGMLAIPTGDSPVSYVDARDVGEVGAKVLAEEGHEGSVYSLTGPQSLRHTEIASQIGAVLGREVAYRAATPEQASAAMLDAGMPEWLVGGLVELYTMYASGEAAVVTDDVSRLLGRPARSLGEFLTEHAPALRGEA